MNFREFVDLLDERDHLVRISKETDPEYEIPTLMKMMDGTPLFFENVKGHGMPVVGNICSSRNWLALGLGVERSRILDTLTNAMEKPQEPEEVEAHGYVELEPDLGKLPILTYYPMDGGPYIASAVAVANDPEYGANVSYHRGMVASSDRLVFRICPRNLDKYIERGLEEFAYCLGNPVSVLMAGAISEGIDVNELAIANALQRTPVMDVDGHKVPLSEIIIIVRLIGEMQDEGPFLDLTETPDIVRKQHVGQVKRILARKNPMFHAVLPGGLAHRTLMGMPREPSIFREVAKVCDVRDVLVTPGGCSWLHGAVKIRKRAEDDGRRAMDAALRGHPSMKHVFVVDEDIDIQKPEEIEWAMATRFQGDRDVTIRREEGSSLDPSSDLETRVTTKMGFDLTIPWGRSPGDFRRPELPLKLEPNKYLS